MKTIQEYLDLAKQANDLPSDYALAKELDLSNAEVALIRTNQRKINDTFATKLALSIGIEPMEVIAVANYWQGSEKNKNFWLWFYEKHIISRKLPKK